MNTRELAETIAADLFTNGAGEHATRLILAGATPRDLGGWNELAVADRVEKAIRGTFYLAEEQRQMILLAIGQLAHTRPGWLEALREIADVFQGQAMFDDFRELAAGGPLPGLPVSRLAETLAAIEQSVIGNRQPRPGGQHGQESSDQNTSAGNTEPAQRADR